MRLPNKLGYFGPYGGRFVPETVMSALLELEEEFKAARRDLRFKQDLKRLQCQFGGRPTPLYLAGNLSRKWGAKIYLKREDLNHTGAHKLNNCLGQALLARRMGKKRVIAETGAGQHGVATAAVAALFGFDCTVYMGEEDIERQKPNVLRMKMLGAEIVPVRSGTKTLKDATNQAIRDWVTNVRTTHYIIGSTVGPHPYPLLVREFQSVIGQEARRQILKEAKRLPDYVIACVGGGSNALGIFSAFFKTPQLKLVGVESAGTGLNGTRHAATLSKGRPGVLHGSYSYLLQTKEGQIIATHSIAAGLDYPGVGPEHSYLKDAGRVTYAAISDAEALKSFEELCKTEGIIPALEACFALAYTKKLCQRLDRDKIVVVNLSGRGDKDLESVSNILQIKHDRTK